MMIACDHAGNKIPNKLGSLGLAATLLEDHIAYDIGARQVAMILSKQFDAPLLLANYAWHFGVLWEQDKSLSMQFIV